MAKPKANIESEDEAPIKTPREKLDGPLPKLPEALKAALDLLSKPFKQPKTVAEAADLAYQLRQSRYSLQHYVEDVKARETALTERLIADLPVSKATGTTGKVAHAEIDTKEEPVPEDWDAIQQHIIKTKSWDLIQKRLGIKGVKERWAAGKIVPGVGKMIKKTVSLTKA